MTTKEIPSIKAQLRGITDQELQREELVKEYFNGEERVTVYTILRRVSSSGMTRHISLKIAQGGEIYDITYNAALALGEKLHDVNGFNTIKVNGCGMDMGFHLVYSLSSVLFHGQDRAGYKIAQRWM
jgi:hypothetical protein